LDFNINHYVHVKLTDAGRKMHRVRYEALIGERLRDLYPYQAPEEDSDGWSRWQLHDLMNTFGLHTTVGCMDLPFETTIRIPESQE
jgi:hypothetical protein